MLAVYEEIEPELKERVEDVILNRRPADGTERLVTFAESYKKVNWQGRGEGRGPVAATLRRGTAPVMRL